MIEYYKIAGVVAVGLMATYILMRALGYFAFIKLRNLEQDAILTKDEYKTKGRFE